MPNACSARRRVWRLKTWTTREGKPVGGAPFTRTTLHVLLSNPVYAGQIRHRDQLYPGEHEAILDPACWTQVQQQLSRGKRKSEQQVNRFGALLLNLVHGGSGLPQKRGRHHHNHSVATIGGTARFTMVKPTAITCIVRNLLPNEMLGKLRLDSLHLGIAKSIPLLGTMVNVVGTVRDLRGVAWVTPASREIRPRLLRSAIQRSIKR